jgi:hypothetical protein
VATEEKLVGVQRNLYVTRYAVAVTCHTVMTAAVGAALFCRRRRRAAADQATALREGVGDSAFTTERERMEALLYLAFEAHAPEMQQLLMAAVQRLRWEIGGAVASVPLTYSTSAIEADVDVRHFISPRASRSGPRRIAIVFESDYFFTILDDDARVCRRCRRCALLLLLLLLLLMMTMMMMMVMTVVFVPQFLYIPPAQHGVHRVSRWGRAVVVTEASLAAAFAAAGLPSCAVGRAMTSCATRNDYVRGVDGVGIATSSLVLQSRQLRHALALQPVSLEAVVRSTSRLSVVPSVLPSVVFRGARRRARTVTRLR